MRYLIVMGAAVVASGEPSGALRRRLDQALTAGSGQDVRYLVTGGVGRHGDAEAAVMRRYLVAHNVSPDRIVEDPESRDTLESVINCSAILRAAGNAGIVEIYSDTYHLPRCVLLFRVLGIKAKAGTVQSGRAANGARRWLWYWLREAIALPYDLILAMYFNLTRRN